MLRFIEFGEHFKLPMYNLMVALGIVAGILVLHYRLRRAGYTDPQIEKVNMTLGISIAVGFIGAFLFDGWVSEYAVFSLETLNTIGFTFYGGFLTAAVLVLILVWALGLPYARTLNYIVPSLALAHGFGRIACFLGGCCFGAPTDHVCGVTYPEGSYPVLYYGGEQMPLHPTQLYEAGFLFLLFGITAKVPVGRNLPLIIYLMGYGMFRFLVEYIRADYRGKLFGIELLSPSQLVSVGVFLAGVGVALYTVMKRPNVQQPQPA